MKKKFLKSIGLLAMFLLLTSGGPITVKVVNKPLGKIDKVAYLSAYLNFTKEFKVSVYTGSLNKKTNSIAKELNSMLEHKADFIRDSLAVALSKTLNCEVLYGESLHKMTGYNVLKAKYNFNGVLATKEDEYFPNVWQSNGDNNFFEFTKVSCDRWGDGIPSYFNKSSHYNDLIVDICRTLDVSYVCFSYSNILTIAKGIKDNLLTNQTTAMTFFILFNKEGKFVAYGYNNTDKLAFDATDVNGYERVCTMIPSTTQSIFNKMITKF